VRVRRILKFWRRSMPILVKYKRMEAKSNKKGFASEEEEKRCWEELHNKSAPQVTNLCYSQRACCWRHLPMSCASVGTYTLFCSQVEELMLDLRGVYVKLGQIIASRNDFTPKIYQVRVQPTPSLLVRASCCVLMLPFSAMFRRSVCAS
jgi:hypothetical protein